MNVFLSYSSSESVIAERLAYRLRDDGHKVFFDRASLPPGEAYDARIRDAVADSDLLLFLLSPQSVAAGSYALTELGIAQHKWHSPSGHVLPVLVSEVDIEALPPYLNAVTVLRSQGDLVADVAVAVSRMRERRILPRVYTVLVVVACLVLGTAAWYWWPAGNETNGPDDPVVVTGEPVKVIGSPGNAGWTLTLDIIHELPLTEIFYRFAEDDRYRSTGFGQHRDRRTGQPQPRYQIEAGQLRGRRTLLVKFSDRAGVEHGPYHVVFDASDQTVAWVKQVLEVTKSSWLGFREYPQGRMLVYFSHLLSYKNALREIRYSVDDESLTQRVHFLPADNAGATSRIDDEDMLYTEIPMTAQFVALKLVFIDGTEWPLRRFPVKPTL